MDQSREKPSFALCGSGRSDSDVGPGANGVLREAANSLGLYEPTERPMIGQIKKKQQELNSYISLASMNSELS